MSHHVPAAANSMAFEHSPAATVASKGPVRSHYELLRHMSCLNSRIATSVCFCIGKGTCLAASSTACWLSKASTHGKAFCNMPSLPFCHANTASTWPRGAHHCGMFMLCFCAELARVCRVLCCTGYSDYSVRGVEAAQPTAGKQERVLLQVMTAAAAAQAEAQCSSSGSSRGVMWHQHMQRRIAAAAAA